MDILAHGLWTGAGALAAKKITKKPIRLFETIAWGVFPDFFAFTFIAFWYTYKLLIGNDVSSLPTPLITEPFPGDSIWAVKFTSVLYMLGHSAPVFFAVFSIVYALAKQIRWEMFGWLFHVATDVFTHPYTEFPTPVFWPLSEWSFDGFPWHTLRFLAVNYSVLIFAYLIVVLFEWGVFAKVKAATTKYLSLRSRKDGE